MRVSALSMAFYRPSIAVTSLIIAVGGVAACKGFKKVPDACSVTIAPRDLTVPVNSSATVVGTAFDCDSHSIAAAKVTFASTNSAIASVTPQGVIIGISVGTVKISANANGKSGEANVTVTPERVATVTLMPATVTLRRNGSQQFTVVGKNSQGTVIPGINFTWSSSNSSLASVDNTGKVTALAPGNVFITATSDGQTGQSAVTITEVPIGSCQLAPGSQKIIVGQTVGITPSLKDTASNPLPITGRALNWASDNSLVASVSQTGIITGIKQGSARITASSPENSAINCSATVDVVNPNIKFVTIQPIAATLRLDVPRQYTVQLLDSNNAVLPSVGRTIVWKTLTPGTTTVTGSGVVRGIALGAGRVAVDAEGVADTASFTITKIPIQSITVAPPSASVVQGQSKQFITTVTDTAGTVVTDRDVSWSTSDPTKATVSPTGLVATTASGTVTITASTTGAAGQLSASATLTITPVPVDTIVVVSTTVSVPKNTTTQFAITLRDAAGNELRNRNVQVTSDHPEIAVAAASAASTTVTVGGVGVGTAILTLQAVNANGQNEGKATKVTVTVTAAIP